MLVLSRKKGEKIHVGDSVITILKITGSNVRVGTDADKNIKIVRGELLDESPRQEPKQEMEPAV